MQYIAHTGHGAGASVLSTFWCSSCSLCMSRTSWSQWIRRRDINRYSVCVTGTSSPSRCSCCSCSCGSWTSSSRWVRWRWRVPSPPTTGPGTNPTTSPPSPSPTPSTGVSGDDCWVKSQDYFINSSEKLTPSLPQRVKFPGWLNAVRVHLHTVYFPVL